MRLSERDRALHGRTRLSQSERLQANGDRAGALTVPAEPAASPFRRGQRPKAVRREIPFFGSGQTVDVKRGEISPGSFQVEVRKWAV